MWRAYACLFGLVLGLTACGEPERGVDPVPLAADEVIRIDGMTVSRYSAGHPRTRDVLDRLVTDPRVGRELGRFERWGYAIDRGSSLHIEAERGDGASLSMTIVSLASRQPPALEAVHLFCLRGDRGFVVIPVRVRGAGLRSPVLSPARPTDPEGIVVEIIEPLDPFPGDAPGPLLGTAKWNWGRWATCVGGVAAYAAARCSTHCLLTGPGFWHCFTVCTTPRVLGGLVGCTFRELAAGDD